MCFSPLKGHKSVPLSFNSYQQFYFVQLYTDLLKECKSATSYPVTFGSHKMKHAFSYFFPVGICLRGYLSKQQRQDLNNGLGIPHSIFSPLHYNASHHCSYFCHILQAQHSYILQTAIHSFCKTPNPTSPVKSGNHNTLQQHCHYWEV